MNDSFLPTGLLAPEPSISPPAFVSNGLLGGESIPTLDSIADTHTSQNIPHSSDDTSQLKNDGMSRRGLFITYHYV